MARYKPYSYSQGKFIPIHFESQILPGTFEHTLSHLIEHELDLSRFDKRFRNDENGAPAYDPRILLKIVLFAYSRGIVSSRRIERACRENVIFMALSADTRPHFTTIADFISSMDAEVIHLFRDVLLVCDEMGLIGKETFTERMKHKIDSTAGRALYSLRVAIAEPPFAHICQIMGLDRFTLRGKKKVNTQWNLCCIVHNLKKVARYGPELA